MKKILIVGMTDFPGGLERYIYNYCNVIDRTKYHIYILNECDGKIAYEEQLNQLGATIVKVIRRKANCINHYFGLIKLFKQYKFDVVYYNTLDLANVDVLMLAPFFNRAVIRMVHAHNSQGAAKGLRRLLMRVHQQLLPLLAERRLACSIIAGKWMYAGKSFEVINNGIDLAKFILDAKKKMEMLQKLNLQGKRIYGTVGRLGMQKNPTFCVEIMKHISNIEPNSVFLHIGDGPMREEMEKLIRENDLQDKYLLVGKIDDVEDYYQVMDMFILPSIYEGLPFVLIEAQAMGIPCLVTDNDCVCKETDLGIGLVQFMTLESGAENWAKKVVSMPVINDTDRYMFNKKVDDANFGLNTCFKNIV